MARLTEIFQGIFSSFFTRSKKEELMAEYVIREHHRGRPLSDILEDAHLRNNLSEQQIRRLLDRPELVHAIGADTIAEELSEL